jgi:AcrR family transcriptional regulator
MADIGAALGIRGPSLYKHVTSKQQLLVEIMVGTMEALLTAQRVATAAGGTADVRLRRMIEAHVRFHARHREQAFVGNREIDRLDEPHRQTVLGLRADYERGLQDVIREGVRGGAFGITDPKLASYALLDMGIGVATWFDANGAHSSEQVALMYADFAIAVVAGSRSDQG